MQFSRVNLTFLKSYSQSVHFQYFKKWLHNNKILYEVEWHKRASAKELQSNQNTQLKQEEKITIVANIIHKYQILHIEV